MMTTAEMISSAEHSVPVVAEVFRALWERFDEELLMKASEGFAISYTVHKTVAFCKIPVTFRLYRVDSTAFEVYDDEFDEPAPATKDRCCADRAKEAEFKREWRAVEAGEQGLSDGGSDHAPIADPDGSPTRQGPSAHRTVAGISPG